MASKILRVAHAYARVVEEDDQSEPKHEQLAATVRELRRARGWSHADLSKEAIARAPLGQGVSPKTVGNLEKGRHSSTLGTVIAVARALDVEPWQLFLPLPSNPKLLAKIVNDLLRRDETAQRAIQDVVTHMPESVVPIRPTHPDKVANAS